MSCHEKSSMFVSPSPYLSSPRVLRKNILKRHRRYPHPHISTHLLISNTLVSSCLWQVCTITYSSKQTFITIELGKLGWSFVWEYFSEMRQAAPAQFLFFVFPPFPSFSYYMHFLQKILGSNSMDQSPGGSVIYIHYSTCVVAVFMGSP